MKKLFYKAKPFSACIFLSILLTVSSVKVFAQPAMGNTTFATAVTTVLSPAGACTSGRTGTTSGFTFTLFSAVNCSIIHLATAPSDGQVQMNSVPLTTGIWQQGRIASSDGSEFQLDNFVFAVLSAPFVGKTITVTGYRNGSPVAGATAVSSAIIGTGFTNNITVNVSSDPDFDNIDEFRLTPSGTDAQGNFAIMSIAVSAAAVTLPVTFQNVQAFASNNGVNVNFTTSDESNMDNYEVQVSTDGIQFVTKQTLSAKNSTNNHYESFIAGQQSNVWIRIKSNEIDGLVKYSKVLFIRKIDTKDLFVYPNPAQEILYVNGANNKQYSITDLQGRIQQRGQVADNKIRVGELASGIYILVIDQRSFRVVKD